MSSCSITTLIAAALLLTAANDCLQAQCKPQWSEQFPTDVLDGAVSALMAFDEDGPGPNAPVLYAGGAFSSAGGIDGTRGLARWDGASWASLDGGMAGCAGSIQALTTFDDDGAGPNPAALYAVGCFTSAGGVNANGIAQWSAELGWSPLDSGISSSNITSMVVFDADGDGPQNAALYVGGGFSSAGGVPAANIARWDGSSWSALGAGAAAGTNGTINALAAFDDDGPGPNPPALYVAGWFTTAGGLSANRIAKWTAASGWSAVGQGMNNSINALAVFDPDGAAGQPPALYAGGNFVMAGGNAANRIARWDGQSWSALGTGINGPVTSFLPFDDDGPGPNVAALYVGGGFELAGGLAANNIVRWDGSSWSVLDEGTDGQISALAEYDGDGAGPALPRLLVGGAFSAAGDVGVGKLAQWDGASWAPFGRGINSDVMALARFDHDGPGPLEDELIVGGSFTTVANITAFRIAAWNGAAWSAMGDGADGPVLTLAAADSDKSGASLFAGGSFTTIGGVAANRVARWDGTSWEALGAGMNGTVSDLLIFDEDGSGPSAGSLFAAGSFSMAGGMPAAAVAQWSAATESWSALGSGMNGAVLALAGFDEDDGGPGPPALYAGGWFTSAGGLNAPRIAKWDGAQWSAVGSGINGTGFVIYVGALEVFDDDGPGPNLPHLYAGGAFSTGGGVTTANIAKWNGSSWSGVGGGVNAPVNALTVFDIDGEKTQGAVLYVGGSFTLAGGLGAAGIAQWNGASWTSLAAGLAYGGVAALAAFDDDEGGPAPPALYAGGSFSSAGGLSSGAVARWGCPAPIPDCLSDVRPLPDGDGIVNVQDLLGIIASWGPCPAPPDPCIEDIAPPPSGNGMVNVQDLLMVIGDWGSCPP